MKTNTLVNSVLLLLFFGTVKLHAQNNYNNGEKDKIVFSNWLNPMDSQLVDMEQEMTITLFSQHTLHVYLRAITAPVETIADFPDLYIDYTFGPHKGIIGPLVDADFIPITLINGEAAMQASFPMSFEFVEECNSVDKSGVFELPVSFSLMTLTPDSYAIYPVLDYPALFPLGWFNETDLPFPLPTFNATKLLDCQGVTTYDRDKDSNHTSTTHSPMSVQPNPFTNDLQISYQIQQPTKLQLKVLNAFGQVFYEQAPLRKEAGTYQSSIPLHHLPAGLYYLQVDMAGHSEVKKIVKN